MLDAGGGGISLKFYKNKSGNLSKGRKLFLLDFLNQFFAKQNKTKSFGGEGIFKKGKEIQKCVTVVRGLTIGILQ